MTAVKPDGASRFCAVRKGNMSTSSRKRIITDLVLATTCATIGGWVIYYAHLSHGVLHHLFETISCIIFVCVFATFAVYGAKGTGSDSRSYITGPTVESTLVRVVYWLPETLARLAGAKSLNIIANVVAGLFCIGTLVDLFQAYFHGGYDNTVRAIAGCASLFCLLIFGLRLDDVVGVSTAETAAERREIVLTALTKLGACLIAISGSVAWGNFALKNGGFFNWWGFVCCVVSGMLCSASLYTYAGPARFGPSRCTSGRCAR